MIDIIISLTAILSLAIGSIVLSVYNATKDLHKLSNLNDTVTNSSTSDKTTNFTIKLCIQRVISLSILLLLMFLFETSVTTITFWVSSLFAYGCQIHVLKRLLKWRWNYKNDNIVTCFCILFSMAWFGSDYHNYEWLIRNIYGVFIIGRSLEINEMPNIRMACIYLTLMFCYDIFWVFLSPYIFGSCVMETAITTAMAPIVFFKMPFMNGYVCLGFGDIIIPGFLLILLKRIDINRNKKSITNGYYIIGLCGYTFGLILTFVISSTMGTSQPALLYIVPCTLYLSLIVAYYRNELDLIWKYKVC